jgi:hypothetical protein
MRLCLLLALAAACSNGNDEVRMEAPAVPVIQVASGDQPRLTQPGVQRPLAVSVTSEGAGAPLTGVTVQWFVEKGDAAVEPSTTMTGERGLASTNVRVFSPGAAVIVARLANDKSVVFRVTAADGASPPPG